MPSYSIAEAKTHLPRIIHEAENSGAIHLTRYGKPVAVILSASEYAMFKRGQQSSTKQALLDFLGNDQFKNVDVDTTLFEQNRKEQTSRKISL